MMMGVSWYGSFFTAPIRLPGPFFWPPDFLPPPPCDKWVFEAPRASEQVRLNEGSLNELPGFVWPAVLA